MIDPRTIPAPVLEVLELISRAGHRAVLVGGGVRDLLLGTSPKDFDVATSATPAEVQALFRRTIPTGIDHGTVTVIHRGRHVEVTTFRSEAEYVDGRRPSKVEFHTDVDADLSRRDFTINAMAWEPEAGLIDPFGGQADLAARLVRCVGEPMARFTEDGLRPLRAVRFATVLDFTLHPPTAAAIPGSRHVFRKVAAERVKEELGKILLSRSVVTGLSLLRATGLMEDIVAEAMAVELEPVGRTPADEALRLAALLAHTPSPRITVLRLKFPNRVADEVHALVAALPLPGPEATDPGLRRYLARVGLARLPSILALDRAFRPPGPVHHRLEAIAAQRPPLSARDLALNGGEIMLALQISPSPEVGAATRFLVDHVLDEPDVNTKEGLKALLRRWKSGSR